MLKQLGVARIYTPKDFDLNRIMMDVVALIDERTAALAARRSAPAAHNPALVLDPHHHTARLRPDRHRLRFGQDALHRRQCATQGLSLFVFNLALPALAVPHHGPDGAARLGTRPLVDRLFRRPQPGVDRRFDRAPASCRRSAGGGGASAAMSATFGNVVMLGVPLTLSHFGEAGMVPASFIVSVHAPLLWLAATLHFETARQGRTPSILRIAQAARSRIHPQPDRARLASGLGLASDRDRPSSGPRSHARTPGRRRRPGRTGRAWTVARRL